MKTVKIQVALAILLGVCVAGTSSFAQAPGEAKTELKAGSSLLEAVGTPTSKVPNSVYRLNSIKYGETSATLPVLFKDGSLVNSLKVGTGICRAFHDPDKNIQLDVIGWVTHTAAFKPKTTAGRFGRTETAPLPDEQALTGVFVDRNSLIDNHFGPIKDNERIIVQVICARGMDYNRYFGCQLDAASKSKPGDAQEVFEKNAAECQAAKENRSLQPTGGQPAVIDTEKKPEPKAEVKKEEQGQNDEDFDFEFEGPKAPAKAPAKKQQ